MANPTKTATVSIEQMSGVVGAPINELELFRALIAKSTTATASTQPNILFIGDSIVQNTGANSELSGFPRMVKNALDLDYGVSGFGYRGYSELSANGTWAQTLEGTALKTWVGTPASTSVTFKATFSRVDIIYGTKSGGGSFNVTIDGANHSINCDATESWHNVETLDFGLSTLSHTVIINPPLTGGVYIEGLVFHAQSTGVQVQQLGHPGLRANQYRDNPDAIKATITDFNPILSCIMLGTNDYGGQVSIANFTSALTQLTAAGKLSGDVMLMAMGEPEDGELSAIPYSAYVTAISEVARINNCAFLTIYDLWQQSFVWANSNGYMFDTVHPTQLGHNSIAMSLLTTLGVTATPFGLVRAVSDATTYDGRLSINANDTEIAINEALSAIKVDVSEAATTHTVSLSPWQPSSAYGVFVSVNWDTTWYVSAKSYNHFDVTFGTPAPAGAEIDWQIKRY
jgi:lysophospholipase L1-like esterase